MYIINMNYSSFNPSRIPTKDEIDKFTTNIGMSSKIQIPEKITPREDPRNFVYSNTKNNFTEDRQTKKLTCDKHGFFEETPYNKFKYNLDDGCPECNGPKPKMVKYQCPNSGDGTERLIEEGSMSHRCPECIYNGKKYTFIHLNGMSYCS